MPASLGSDACRGFRLSVNAERSGQAASGLLLATDVADYLVARGMPFRRAHEVVGAMVGGCWPRARLQHIEHGRMARGKRDVR